MKSAKFLFVFFFFGVFFSCQSETKPAEIKEVASSISLTKVDLPSLPQEIRDQLFNDCDYVDFIFYQQNFSMSLNEKPSIQQIVAVISGEPATFSSPCQPVGRVFFQVKGKIITEADLHFVENNCVYFTFMENGKPAYANNLNEAGASLFKNYLMQGAKIQQTGAAN